MTLVDHSPPYWRDVKSPSASATASASQNTGEGVRHFPPLRQAGAKLNPQTCGASSAFMAGAG